MEVKKIAAYRKWIILAAVLASLVICAAVFYFMIVFYVPWKWQEGSHIYYDGLDISANGKYVGVIDLDKEKVRICTHSGREFSSLDISKDYPNQIALGESSYFLLYLWEEEGNHARIVQYDYQSGKMKECKVPNVATIACRDGFLFLGNWKHEEEDAFRYFNSFYKSFYAHSYIQEEKFGRHPQELDLQREGECLIGSVKLYNHQQKYFSTEPMLGDYPGTSGEHFQRDDKLDGYLAQTKQEEKNRSLLLQAIGGVEGLPEPVYSVQEYQKGNLIYGVCNVLAEKLPHRPTAPGDVARTYFYQINPAENQCRILDWKDSCLGIFCTDSWAVYQRGDEILRQSISSKKETSIYRIKNTHDLSISVSGDFLLVEEKEKPLLPIIFSTDEKEYQVIFIGDFAGKPQKQNRNLPSIEINVVQKK